MNEDSQDPRPDKLKGGAWEFVKMVIISLLIVLPIRAYIAQPFIVAGASMEPNYHNGEYLIIDELSFLLRNPERGEVVVFRYPADESQFFIKRIVGLPGETVTIRGGEVLIEKDEETFALIEAYLPKNLKTIPDTVLILGAEEYFVLGDNRGNSSDSRHWGALAEDNLIGRALLRLWPVAKIGILAE